MISTAIRIQDATKDAVMDRTSVGMARAMFTIKDMLDEESFARAIFDYSAHLTSLTATMVAEICLTESDLIDMINVIKEFDTLTEEE